jgi:hypothetical protein
VLRCGVASGDEAPYDCSVGCDLGNLAVGQELAIRSCLDRQVTIPPRTTMTRAPEPERGVGS